MFARTRERFNRIIALLAVFTLLLGACGPATTEPTPPATPTPGEPTATPLPTATPPPTVTPMPLPPPRLVYRSPAPGEQQPLDEPIELTFDQPMDRDSVESALTISPTVDLQPTWADDRTVTLSARDGLERGTRYTMTIAATARNVEGESLEEPAVFDVETVGYLAVSEVMPAPNSEELDPDMAVTVVFDRPVVPLTAISGRGELPDPLTFMPPVRGEGEWLNTSIYLFRPEEGFLPATHYKARVAGGLTDTSGGVLANDYTWEFTTFRPAILEIQPSNYYRFFGPSEVISVTFNQPMDHASVQDHFSLETDERPVIGSFRWSGGETPTSPETMVFVPADPLPRETTFTTRVDQGALARAGHMGTPKDRDWQFSTVRDPGIRSTWPSDGALDVPLGESVLRRMVESWQILNNQIMMLVEEAGSL